jgi:hypothetical protein
MGRGRAKAKQTKVARDLKYRSYDPDFDQLQRELHGKTGSEADESTGDELEDPYDDESADAHTGDGTKSARRP